MQYNYFHQGYYDIKITDVLFGRIRGENVEFRAANELGTNANDWLKD
ncbi:MAG TPA: hypothetical protein PK390_02990 [Fervidobacterium nodosum]|nr:hypothetical protein [Fervidobacterium nodosum]